MLRHRRVLLAVAAAAALVLSLTAMAQAAPARAKADVLTTSRVGGPDVRSRAVLTAGLAPKTTFVFNTASFRITCRQASISLKVVSNPSRGHVAVLSETNQRTGKCKAFGRIAKSITVSLIKLPRKTKMSGSKGDPVVVSGPVVKIVAKTTFAGTVTCVYTAKRSNGRFSDKSQSVTFARQASMLDLRKSSQACLKTGISGTYTASFGPLRDTGVKGKPRVFVN